MSGSELERLRANERLLRNHGRVAQQGFILARQLLTLEPDVRPLRIIYRRPLVGSLWTSLCLGARAPSMNPITLRFQAASAKARERDFFRILISPARGSSFGSCAQKVLHGCFLAAKRPSGRISHTALALRLGNEERLKSERKEFDSHASLRLVNP